MKRVDIARDGDLSTSFRIALNVLADAKIQIRPGTKLLTRYAVIVVDDDALDDASRQLLAAAITTQRGFP